MKADKYRNTEPLVTPEQREAIEAAARADDRSMAPFAKHLVLQGVRDRGLWPE